MFKWTFLLELHLTTSRLPKTNHYLNIRSSSKSRRGSKSRWYMASSSSTWSEAKRGRGRLVMMREEACLTDASCPAIKHHPPTYPAPDSQSTSSVLTEYRLRIFLILKLWHDNALSLKMLSSEKCKFWGHFLALNTFFFFPAGFLRKQTLTP